MFVLDQMLPIPNAAEGKDNICYGRDRQLPHRQGRKRPTWLCTEKTWVFEGARQMQTLQAGKVLQEIVRDGFAPTNLPP